MSSDAFRVLVGGRDIHRGLRVRVEHDPTTNTFIPRWSSESGVDAFTDVTERIRDLRDELRDLEQWAWLYRHQPAGQDGG